MDIASIDPIILFLALGLVGCSLYVCFGRNIINVTMALLLHYVFLGGVFLYLEQEFLALIGLFTGLSVAVTVFSFSSLLMGNMRETQMALPESIQDYVLAIGGFAFGILLAVGLAYFFLKFGQFKLEPAAPPQESLGTVLLGRHTLVFEIFAFSVMSLAMGTGVILRKGKAQ